MFQFDHLLHGVVHHHWSGNFRLDSNHMRGCNQNLKSRRGKENIPQYSQGHLILLRTHLMGQRGLANLADLFPI